ncbi:MAG: nucleoside hydrolase [Candidatus Aminicenantales bacterium]
MKKLSVCIVGIIVLGIGLHLHSGQAKYPVIIDTDGGFDDLRAILMFLAGREFEVLAITASEGSLTPPEGIRKVRSLLKTLHHEGISTAAGRSLDIQPPPWRRFCQDIPWGEESPGPPAGSQKAVDLLSCVFENEERKVWLVCLGSLTTASDFFARHPDMESKTERIVWYNDAAGASKSFNYTINEAAAEEMFHSGLKMDVVKAMEETPLQLDSYFLKELTQIKTPGARILAGFFEVKEVPGKKALDHSILRDDLIPIFLLNPGIFTSERKDRISLNFLKDESAGRTALEIMIKILSVPSDTECQVFVRFPTDPALYAADIRPYIPEIIERHGESEWRAGVLTNELHGHLGIYAIIGVKMGLRAREYFNGGIDDMAVLSLAGRKPPVSCLNDGLQVSTGGTLGHGLITVSQEPRSKPEAVFAYNNHAIRISLKPEIAATVEAAIREAIERFGNLTESYWNAVRQQAIKLWLELDRHEIFIVESVQ